MGAAVCPIKAERNSPTVGRSPGFFESAARKALRNAASAEGLPIDLNSSGIGALHSDNNCMPFCAYFHNSNELTKDTNIQLVQDHMLMT